MDRTDKRFYYAGDMYNYVEDIHRCFIQAHRIGI